MTKTLSVQITEKHSMFGWSGLYEAEIGKHEIEIDQTCADNLHDMVQGLWNVEFDNGQIILNGKIEVPYKPNRCDICGKRVAYWRTWCSDCLFKQLSTP